VLEEFVARVFKDGKITIPKHLRDLHCVTDGDYVRSALIEVLKKGDNGEWTRKKVT
jgi:bifunctional DNA-binding transcriptional regulator/antitoxin component of YhaV-PrlF toxin-antitoxin module